MHVLVQDGVDDERVHLARHDHQLVDRDHAAAAFGGRHLGEVERDGRSRGPDAETQQDPGGHHDTDVRCRRAAQRADEEQAAAHEQRPLAAERVGQLPAEQRTDGGAGEEQHAHDRGLGRRAEVQVVAHVEQGAGDDPGVVAEQETAQCRDDGEFGQEPTPGTRIDLDPGTPLARRVRLT